MLSCYYTHTHTHTCKHVCTMTKARTCIQYIQKNTNKPSHKWLYKNTHTGKQTSFLPISVLFLPMGCVCVCVCRRETVGDYSNHLSLFLIYKSSSQISPFLFLFSPPTSTQLVVFLFFFIHPSIHPSCLPHSLSRTECQKRNFPQESLRMMV